MDEEPILIVEDPGAYRYASQTLLAGWNQAALQRATVGVIGAGALGNEVLKNLALLGVGRIFIVDRDIIETSNLSRSVLFRPGDEGQPKAIVAARRIKEWNPDVQVHAVCGDVDMAVGRGMLRRLDVVLGCLDNRESRLAINRSCWRVGTTWIDGGMLEFSGAVRVFIPMATPCYECGFTELDYQMVNVIYSCRPYTRDDLQSGNMPTVITSTSIIAGMQTQELVKLLMHIPREFLAAGKEIGYNAETNTFYSVDLPWREDCPAHERFDPIIELDLTSEAATPEQLLTIARADLGPNAVLDFGHDIVTERWCPNCGLVDRNITLLAALTMSSARCPACQTMQIPEVTCTYDGSESFGTIPLAALGIPPLEIIIAKTPEMEYRFYELSGDAEHSYVFTNKEA
jgi:molybdopterin/thiamine biosynthesis adenylyltransferase